MMKVSRSRETPKRKSIWMNINDLMRTSTNSPSIIKQIRFHSRLRPSLKSPTKEKSSAPQIWTNSLRLQATWHLRNHKLREKDWWKLYRNLVFLYLGQPANQEHWKTLEVSEWFRIKMTQKQLNPLKLSKLLTLSTSSMEPSLAKRFSQLELVKNRHKKTKKRRVSLYT